MLGEHPNLDVNAITASSKEENDRYKIWLGIRYLWGPDGPVELGSFPENASKSTRADVQAGWALKQNCITEHKGCLISCLHVKEISA